MKRTLWILSLIAAPLLVRGDDELPTRFKFDRYQKMLDHSPFAVASAVVAPIAPPDFAKGLYVANAAKTPDGDLVTIQSTDDKSLKEYLSTTGPNEHGYGISNIEWSETPGGTRVTISKDQKFATLTFNQALITSGPVPPPPVPPPQFQGGQPAPQSGFPKPPVRVPPPNVTPHTRGVIPRNPNALTQPLPQD